VCALTLALLLLFQGTPAGPPGTVTGQLRAMDGSPAISVRVAAIPVPSGNSVPADGPQYFVAAPPSSTALTDNQGRFRLLNLPAGRYYILGGVVGEPTYYPETIDWEKATPVTVAAGSTLPNINFKLLRPYGGKVSGRVNPRPADAQLKATLLGGKLEELLDAPVAADGTFEFGHVPPSTYLLGLFPRPPGFSSLVVKVGDSDVVGLQLAPPPTRTVSGKIVVENGPLPHALLAFSTPNSYVSAPISPDGTFTTHLQAARHQVDLAGMPVGYHVASVRVGSADDTQGFAVGNTDLSGMVITVAAPQRLPRIRGRISGLAEARLASTKVEIAGPIVGSLQASVQKDGSFEFPTVIPGLYTLKLTGVAEFKPIEFTVAGWDTVDVPVTVAAR
jgi:hypothetical protein